MAEAYTNIVKPIVATALFNLQMLPELLVCGLVLLTILLSSQPLFFLALSTGGIQLLLGALNRLLIRMTPESAVVSSTTDVCNGGQIGKTWARLLRNSPDLLHHSFAPSIYIATVSFLTGWGWALQALYKDEVNAGIMSRSTMMAFPILAVFVLLLIVAFRYFQGCDSLVSIAGGAGIGLIGGFFGAIALGYATDRRATNLWGIPLLRDRINNGSAVYICPN